MVKKSVTRTKTRHVSVSPTHLMIKRSLISYAVLVFVAFATISMSIYLLERMATARIDQVRLDRISSIYDGIQLDDSYRQVRSDLFGDKRVYASDKSRTYSSSIEYGHNDTVANTFADLKQKIEGAGFKYFESAYDGTVAKQLHFKNSKGEYVRVSVVTKAAEDMVIYGVPTQEEWQAADKNAAPSYVKIKVNLDDNNE